MIAPSRVCIGASSSFWRVSTRSCKACSLACTLSFWASRVFCLAVRAEGDSIAEDCWNAATAESIPACIFWPSDWASWNSLVHVLSALAYPGMPRSTACALTNATRNPPGAEPWDCGCCAAMLRVPARVMQARPITSLRTATVITDSSVWVSRALCVGGSEEVSEPEVQLPARLRPPENIGPVQSVPQIQPQRTQRRNDRRADAHAAEQAGRVGLPE